MMEAEHSLTDMAMNTGRHHGDEHLLVRFFTDALQNEIKSREEGRAIFEDVPFIQIMQPGNKDSIIVRAATEMDKRRFPEHYRKFKAREDQDTVEGTRLEEWPGVTRSQCEELKYLNILTVEQLANVSDSNGQGIMGIALLKEKAKKYLEASKETAASEALAEMQTKYEALLARVEGMEEPKKRTRKPKAAPQDLESALDE